ncbi:uracil permease-like protein [Zopfochytrium polystomum]|nr:uracil permease-like protein [Zopfochytrium polystomum]
MGIMDKLKFNIEAEHAPGLTNAELMLQNDDLKPVEPARRTWRAYNFVGFWISDGFNITTWTITSGFLIAGLNWWQAWLAVWIGYIFTGVMVALGGRSGAVHHIGFPVVARSSFGIYGALWPVLNRAAMACVWYGVQSWIGGTCITQLLRSIFPSYADIPNSLPESAGVTTRDFLSFFIFWAISLPAIWFPVHQIRHLFTAKMILTPIGGMVFFVWSVVKAGGLGPILSQPATISGSEWSWTFLASIMSCIANFATLIVNDPDFTRFARKPSDAISSTTTRPARTRFGVFFISACFVLAQIGVNIAANSLLPRYISIRRGGFICAAIALCMCPWTLLSSSNNFTLYLSSYSVFLSSISGVLFCDYYAIRRGKLNVAMLYSNDTTHDYWYTFGVSWKAYAAYIAGILINIVGFAGAVSSPISDAATNMYHLAYFLGFIVASGTYYILWTIWPSPGMMKEGWHEKDEYVFEDEAGGRVATARDEIAVDDGKEEYLKSK